MEAMVTQMNKRSLIMRMMAASNQMMMRRQLEKQINSRRMIMLLFSFLTEARHAIILSEGKEYAVNAAINNHGRTFRHRASFRAG